MAYLITFTCYGAHLHGDEFGSVDREHNVYGTPVLTPNPGRVAAEERRARQTAYFLNSAQRKAVLSAILELCSHRGWHLLAIHVRTQHVHLVVTAEDSPEKILQDAKKYSSRRSIVQWEMARVSGDGLGTAARDIFGSLKAWEQRFTMWEQRFTMLSGNKESRWRSGKIRMHWANSPIGATGFNMADAPLQSRL